MSDDAREPYSPEVGRVLAKLALLPPEGQGAIELIVDALLRATDGERARLEAIVATRPIDVAAVNRWALQVIARASDL